MPVNWKDYPPNWKQIAREKKDSVGWKCEVCGAQCRRPGEPFDTHKRTLTVAHLNHTPMDCRPERTQKATKGTVTKMPTPHSQMNSTV